MFGKRRSSLAIGAALAIVFTSTASAGPPAGFHMVQGAIHPPIGFDAQRRSGGLINEWRHARDWRYGEWQGAAQSYAAALRFAECASRLNPRSIELIDRPIGVDGDREALARFVRANRGCVGEQSAVSPLLIRAALAESAMNGGGFAKPVAVGVPEIVDGYPLAAVSRCLVQTAPESVAAVLRTRPGDEAERMAAQNLFRQVPQCAPPQTVRLTPTAARLALVDAIYRGAGTNGR